MSVTAMAEELIEYDIEELERLVQDRDVDGLKTFMAEHDLIVDDGRIKPRLYPEYKSQGVFWDMQQLIAKIKLNSLYGAILNEGSRWFDARIGQSVTLTGRQVVRHMASKINELVTGKYDHRGSAIIYGDTDSILGNANIITDTGTKTIEELFLMGNQWVEGTKQYSKCDGTEVLTYNPAVDAAIFKPFQYVYRHRVTKARWRITDEFGNEVEMTGDHSVMVERDGNLIEAKPEEIQENDVLISVSA